MITQPCPGLVELIEKGDLHSPVLHQLLERYVQPLLAEGADTIILGCTHYPFLKPLLKQMIPDDISLIDTGAAVARQLQRLLAERELLAAGPARAAQFWTSADPVHFTNILPILWNNAGVVRSFEE
ncbi:Glutamate racemase [compost metagenome]